MSLFLEKCKDAVRRTQYLWNWENWTMFGFWCAQKWYQVDLVNKDPLGETGSWRIGVMLAVPFVSPIAYVILPLANALINLLATISIWLALPVVTIVHLVKDNSRREELLTRINTDEDSLIAQLSDNDKFLLGGNLDAEITKYEQNSESSTQFKILYCNPNSAKSLENRLKGISDFINKEGDYNAGRGVADTILSTLRQAQSHLPIPSKSVPTKKVDDIETIEEQTSASLSL